MKPFWLTTLLLLGFLTPLTGQETGADEPVRYITHITQPGGGFQTTILFNNMAASEKFIDVSGYDRDGNILFDSVRVNIPSRTIYERSIGELLSNEVSHLTLSGSKHVLVSVRYDHTNGGRGFSPHLHESTLQANRYQVYPGVPDGNGYWEGAAVVNLMFRPGLLTRPVTPVQILLKTMENQTIASHTIELAGGAKSLVVFSTLFEEIKDAAANKYFYEVRSTVPLGVTALMGNLNTGDLASAHPAAPLLADGVVRRDLNTIANLSYDIQKSSLDSEILTLQVRYDESCNFQPILYWSGNFLESFPVQTKVKLGLENNGAACLDSAVNPELEFDLGLITQEYLRGGERIDPIIVHLLDKDDNTIETFTLNPNGGGE